METWLLEALAVTTYLADTKPEAKLIPPAGSFERVKVLQLQTFIASEISKSSSRYFENT